MDRVELLRLAAMRDRLQLALSRSFAYGDDRDALAIALAVLGTRADAPHVQDEALVLVYESTSAQTDDSITYLTDAAATRLRAALAVWEALYRE